jgi:alginate O-acetyltransferase complex protein AlgI
MVFSSSLFLFGFFPLFLISYFLSPVKYRNFIIIAAGLFFYTWGARSFVPIIFLSCIIDFIFGNLIRKAQTLQNNKLRRLCTIIDFVMNLGILIYFKYVNFFVENINIFLSNFNLNPVTFTAIVLPIGVSFVVFQKSTYCLDIAKGAAVPAKRFSQYIEYLFIFPQIIAGPIIKYSTLSSQIENTENRKITTENLQSGFTRFVIGIFKKVWIADVLAKYADISFNGSPSAIPIHYCWFGLICYAFQIYFDFSAYSDMAIGILKIMGFSVPENFNHPYISKSITEFWKRWHISLTSWMREYLYIPLGGNRYGAIRMIFNQWIVFFLSGLWHGAKWTFVCWGLFHGALLCIEKISPFKKIPSFVKIAMTFFLILIGWIFFRSNDLYSAFAFIRQLFNWKSYTMHPDVSRFMYVDNRGIFIFIIACVMSFLPALGFMNLYKQAVFYISKRTKIRLSFYLFLLAVSALKIGTATVTRFIYFQF